MYAVVRTGGKQYRVGPGDNLEVEKLAGNVGESVVLEDVLLVAGDEGIQIGQPNVEGASVTARITGQHRGEKILVFRYRPKKRIRVRRGHRQYLTRLQILKISGEGYEYVKEERKKAPPESVAEVAELVGEDSEAEVAVVEEVEAGASVAAVAETDSVAVVDETIEAGTEEEADIGDKAVAVVKETVAIAGDAVEAVGDMAGDAVDAVGDKAGDAVDAVGDKAGDAVDAVGDKAGDAVDAVSDKAVDAVDAVGDKAGDAVEAIGGMAGKALDAVAKNLRGLPFVGRGETTGDDADAEEDTKKQE